MAVILGKRKRQIIAPAAKQSQKPTDSSDDDNDATARALFQKAFEAKFKPLEVQPVGQHEEDDDEDSEDEGEPESDWDGFNQDEGEIEVIKHAQPDMDAIFSGLKNAKKKAYMSSKPPTSEDLPEQSVKKVKPDATDDDDGAESTNLKNDLALQRLLKESHLLEPVAFSSSAPEGRSRIKALDMRIQDLGGKASTLKQDKMPLSHRRGIAGKAASREASRRKEAAENGIILEKAKHAAPKMQKKRERGVDGPGIGKMRGGTLKLSSRDIRSIEGSRPGGKGRKR